jgi:hypothetical protein
MNVGLVDMLETLEWRGIELLWARNKEVDPASGQWSRVVIRSSRPGKTPGALEKLSAGGNATCLFDPW